MITVSYNAYCVISKEGDNDIWTVRLWGVVPLLPLCSQIDVGANVNALLGDTFSRKNNTHGSRFHDRDPQFASRILGAMTQSCYIGTRDIRSRVIRGPYCISIVLAMEILQSCTKPLILSAPSEPLESQGHNKETFMHFDCLAVKGGTESVTIAII